MEDIAAVDEIIIVVVIVTMMIMIITIVVVIVIIIDVLRLSTAMTLSRVLVSGLRNRGRGRLRSDWSVSNADAP